MTSGTTSRLRSRSLSMALVLAWVVSAHPAAAEVRDVELGNPDDSGSFGFGESTPVARLADGSYAVAWQDLDRQQAVLQWVRPDGSLLLAPGGRPIPRASVETPTVAANPAAGAFVGLTAFTDQGTRVAVQSFAADASPRWGAAGVFALDAPAGSPDQQSPQLLPSADGGVFVCFLRAAADGVDATVVCQRLGPGGQPRWSGGRAAGGQPGGITSLRLVDDRKGGILVFWSSVHAAVIAGRTSYTVAFEGQRFSPDGRPLWGAGARRLHVTDYDPRSAAFSRISAVSDGQGGAVLAFGHLERRNGRSRIDGVLAQRVDRDGRTLWGNGVIVATGPAEPTLDSLAAAPDGGAFAVILEPLPSSQSRLVLHRLGPDGRLASPIAGSVISAPGRLQADFNSRASFDGGRLRVLWGSHLLGNPFHLEVRIALFDRAGRRLSAADAPPLATGSDTEGPSFSGFAFDPTRDQGLAVWLLSRQSLPSVAAGALFSGDTGLPLRPSLRAADARRLPHPANDPAFARPPAGPDAGGDRHAGAGDRRRHGALRLPGGDPLAGARRAGRRARRVAVDRQPRGAAAPRLLPGLPRSPAPAGRGARPDRLRERRRLGRRLGRRWSGVDVRLGAPGERRLLLLLRRPPRARAAPPAGRRPPRGRAGAGGQPPFLAGDPRRRPGGGRPAAADQRRHLPPRRRHREGVPGDRPADAALSSPRPVRPGDRHPPSRPPGARLPRGAGAARQLARSRPGGARHPPDAPSTRRRLRMPARAA